jgi:hemerythrin superfamily protein
MDIHQDKGKSQEAWSSMIDATDAVEMLRGQHREVEALFDDLERADGRAVKEQIFEALADKVLTHAKIEETIFYPAAREVDEALVMQSFEEHDDVKRAIRKLAVISPDDATFEAEVAALKEMITRHVDEEESLLFPKCEDVFDDDEMEELAVRMQAQMDNLDSAH